MTMRIYAYHAKPPVKNADLVALQMRLAHSYQCALVAIERRRRAVVDHLYQHACPKEHVAHSEAELAVERAVAALRMTRATSGDMLEPDEEMKAEQREVSKLALQALKDARDLAKAARQVWYDAKRAATPRLRRRLQMCDRGARARNKRAYNFGTCVGLAWGTRLKVGESVERAAKASAKEGTLPKFPRFDGGGMAAVQLQGGLDPADALNGDDTRFRLEQCSGTAWHEIRRGAVPIRLGHNGVSRSDKFALAHFRIGSDEREPVWATLPITMHRPLPKDAKIKWAQLIAFRVGARTKWRVLITVDDQVPADKPGGSTLAVNLGWRTLLDGGLRVAYAVGSDDHEEEVRVPPKYVTGVAHVDSLRSIRDSNFSLAKKSLVEWRDDAVLPEWLADGMKWMENWRAQKHLAFLLNEWRRKRFDGDEQIFHALNAWEKKDRHLRFWECDERTKLLRQREGFYRQTAARWAQKYNRIIVTDMDLRDFAELPAPEDAKDTKDALQRRSRFLAAPSELRGAIKNACSTRGTVFAEVSGAYKSQTCSKCGGVMAFPARHGVDHRCSLCGEMEDQDRRHCLNLITGDQKRENEVAVPKEKRGRWQKRMKQAV
jgi:Putative transposase DNA-binding domain